MMDTTEDMFNAIVTAVKFELILKGHAIVKVNNKQVCVVKNNVMPEEFYSAPLSDLMKEQQIDNK